MAIENNMVVSFNYELHDAKTSEVLDKSIEGQPLEFITGKGHIIPSLESEIIMLTVGEGSKIFVAAKDAYGEYNEEAVATHPREQFAGIELAAGMDLYGQSDDGQTVQVRVKHYDDNIVTIDYNHPLAGKDLVFDVKITALREATPEEVLTGYLNAHCEDGMGGGGCGTGCGCAH